MRRLEPPPDLQELVAQFGGYDKITPEAWDRWDHDNKVWMDRLRAGDLEIGAKDTRVGWRRR